MSKTYRREAPTTARDAKPKPDKRSEHKRERHEAKRGLR